MMKYCSVGFAAMVLLVSQSSPAGLSDWDPTNKNSKVRKAGRAIDPTNPASKPREVGRTIDPTNPNSKPREGLRWVDPSHANSGIRRAIRNLDMNDAMAVKDVVMKIATFNPAIEQKNAMQWMLKQVPLDYERALGLGHFTTKWDVRRNLENGWSVIYGAELSHDEQIAGVEASVQSVVTMNPGPMINYLRSFFMRSIDEFFTNASKAMVQAPSNLKQQLLSGMETALKDFVQGRNARWTKIGRLKVEFGIATYKRGERTPFGIIPTPNTHQPYARFCVE